MLRPPAPLLRFVGCTRQLHQAHEPQYAVLSVPHGYVVALVGPENDCSCTLTAEAVNAIILTLLPCRLLPLGTLDVLRNCPNLTSVDVSGCRGEYDDDLGYFVGGLTGT